MDNTPILNDEQFGQINPQDFINKAYEILDNKNNDNQFQVQEPQYTQSQEAAPQQVNTDYQQEQQLEQNYDNPEQSTSQESNIDPAIYKQAYEKITAPFKASGKEFQVRSIDEAVSLMQMGVDYTRKQQALKPRLKEMRTLEDQGMLGNNLNYVIDLYNGNPQAIAKLIKDRGIDVTKLIPQKNEFGEPVQEVDTSSYVPTNHTISDAQYEFKEVCDELRRTDMFNKVADTLEQFDEPSKENFRRNPKLLLSLSNMLSGDGKIYETIKGELDHLRVVNDPRIRGMNDFDAIDVIGNMLYGQPAPVQQQQQVQPQYIQQPVTPPQPQYSPQTFQQQQQMQMQQRKQGAGPVRTNVNRPVSYDPLHCSDEEFLKIDVNELLRNNR